MNLNLGRWKMNRRHVLRGMGATVALPLLDCMGEGGTPGIDTTGFPRRSVFLYIPNGVNTLTWQIQSAGRDYELPGSLAALERHRDDITPISGLHHPNGLGKHHNCDKIWLTGADVPRDGGAFRNSVSIDQLIAEIQGQHTRFSSLEMAVTGHSLSWSRDGIQLPAERSAKAIFNRVFGVEKEGKEAVRRRYERRGSVLDLVLNDARKMARNVGSEDRTKLDEYLSAVRQVEIRTERASSWLNVPKPEVDPVTESRLTRKVDMKQAGEYYKLFYDLMILALRTDMTRVISCMIGSESHGLAIPEIGVVQTRHELSHHNGDPEQMRRLTETDTFLIESYCYFLDQLKEIREQEHTLLDRTQVLWGSGMAYGHSHGNANLPTIVAGGKAFGMRHGEHIDYNLPQIGAYDVANPKDHYQICSKPVDSDARLSNLLLTMGQLAGVREERFQDSTTTISDVVA